MRLSSPGVDTVALLLTERPEELPLAEAGEVLAQVEEGAGQEPEYYCTVMTAVTREVIPNGA